MGHLSGRGIATASVAFLAFTASLSCVDEEIVFRDRVLFEHPATAARGMLGYSDRESGLTVCGNCHVGQQSAWEETDHADAWADLQESGHAQEFCEGCHTVNQLGNALDEPAGHLAVAEERYYDVQCESCHGPGLDHVENPDAEAKPLAPISASSDLTTGCGECHQGAHHSFVEEWEMSAHAQVNTFPAGREGCNACHEGKNALVAMRVNAEYAEVGSSEIVPITCAVCHDPHDATYTAQLRFPIETASVRTHLCAQCHDRRTEPDPTSNGLHPHSPEAALLAGDAGWFPTGAGVEPGELVTSHGTEGNPGLCATCHVASFEVSDPEAGFERSVTGHSFTAIPCLDDQGLPTTQDCGLDLEERSWAGCTEGCHTGSPTAARTALLAGINGIQPRADELEELLLQVDDNLDGPGGPIDPDEAELTTAERAFFNLELARFGGTDRPDPRLAYAAAAAHNPFMTEAVLLASIAAVEDEYGVTASAELVRTRLLKRSVPR